MRLRFGVFTLDLSARQLTGANGPRHVSPKAFDLLVALVDARPAVVPKAVLQQRLWPDTFVADANLSNLVAEVREALGEDSRHPSLIRTAHRVGYAFTAEVTVVPAEVRGQASPTCWLEWGQQRVPLLPGEHIVGRDPGLSVTLDSSTVSRRHARLVVSAAGATLEDLGSKNGTQVNDRLTTTATLANGDAIRVGAILLMFHCGAGASTETHGLTGG